jgi:DNA processing protein
MQINQIFLQDDHYPAQLREISAPPSSLYVLGNLPMRPMIAVVGTRSITAYGKQVTYDLAGELARAGFPIVSGLAYGVDAVAHRAALDAGGTTIAVLAGGLDHIYPTAHRELALEIIAKGGALISENAVGSDSYKSSFVARNRIISGLSVGTVITESGPVGGALRTAKFTLDQNRTLMAVPGDITRLTAAGPNNLIRNGATPVTSSTDVLEALGLNTAAIPASLVRAQNPHEARIVELLKSGRSRSQELIDDTGLEAAEFASIISLMELTGKVRNLGAGVWAAR